MKVDLKPKEIRIILLALDYLINKEEDVKDYTNIIKKLKGGYKI